MGVTDFLSAVKSGERDALMNERACSMFKTAPFSKSRTRYSCPTPLSPAGRWACFGESISNFLVHGLEGGTQF